MAPESSPFHTGILVIAHAPLASALKACALHVFPESDAIIAAYDVQRDTSPENGLAHGIKLVQNMPINQLLLLNDIIGATPFNLGMKIFDSLVKIAKAPKAAKLITGVNVPMIIRAITYRHEPLEKLSELVITGAIQGIVLSAPPHKF